MTRGGHGFKGVICHPRAPDQIKAIFAADMREHESGQGPIFLRWNEHAPDPFKVSL